MATIITDIQSATNTALDALGSVLMNDRSRQNIQTLAGKLPAIKQGFFECHFGAEANADLAMPISIDSKDTINAIMSLNRAYKPADGLLKAGTPLAKENVQNLWFEFDTSATDFNGLPGVFFDLHLLYARNIAGKADANFWAASINSMVPAIGTAKLTKENTLAMQRCITLSAGVGYPAYIGIMKNRKDDLRLCVKLADADHALQYIKNTGMTVTDDTAQKLATLASICDTIAVDMDFDGGKIVPRFGMELHISKDTDQGLHEAQLISYLLQYGLCTAEQAESVSRWTKDGKGSYLHKISHFKVTIEQGAISGAKVYLQYIYR